MEQLLARDPLQQPQDSEGSLTDADMGAYYAASSGLDALAIALAQKASKLRGEEASRSRSSSLHWQRRRAPRLRAVPFCSADARESTFDVVGSSATVYCFLSPLSGHAPEQIHNPRNGRAKGSKHRISPVPVLLR